MAMMKKRMEFHGVDYIVVPVALWEDAYSNLSCDAQGEDCKDRMLAYEGSDEPLELTAGDSEFIAPVGDEL